MDRAAEMTVETSYDGDVKVMEPSVSIRDSSKRGRETVLDVIKDMVSDLTHDERSRRSMLAKSRDVVRQKAPRLKTAARHSTEDLARWIQLGGPWRSFLITVAGLISLVSLTGVAAFLVFFVVATANAVVIALLGSVAAVGTCVAIFFAALTAIYIGALSVAVFAISTIALWTIFTVVTAAGWIAFWWAVWTGLNRVLNVAMGSTAYMTSSLAQAPKDSLRSLS